MAEPLNLELLIKAIVDGQASIQSLTRDIQGLKKAAAEAGTVQTLGTPQQMQRVSGLHTRITQLTGAFRKLGIELETIDLYFISGFKVLGLFKVIEFIKNSTTEAENLKNALKGVELAASLGGYQMVDVMNELNKLLSLGKVGIDDLTESMRNLLKKGYTPSQAGTIIDTLVKSGIVFGTQANMPLGEAVKRATEGILQDLSRLVDATRLTKNLDKMWADFARTIGKNVDALSDYEKRLAVLAYFTTESIGLNSKFLEANTGLTKAVGGLNLAFTDLKLIIGSDINPSVAKLIEYLTFLVNILKEVMEALEKVGVRLFHLVQIPYILREGLINSVLNIFGSKGGLGISEALKYWSKQTDDAIKEIEDKYKNRGLNINLNTSRIILPNDFDRGGYPSLGGTPWWMKSPSFPKGKRETEMMDFGKMIDDAKLEQIRKLGAKVALAFSNPIERGISDVFFNIFTGSKGSSIIEMARNFARAMARAISDALAEALTAPIKGFFTSMFTSMLGSITGTSIPSGGAPLNPGTAVHAPITIVANDTNSFARTMKQNSRIIENVMARGVKKSRNLSKTMRKNY